VIVLTYHAVEQYISRCDRSLTAEAAWEALEAQLPYADRLRQRSLKGDTIWRLPNGAYLVTKLGSRGRHVAVTALAEMSESAHPDRPTEEELDMLLDRVASDPIEAPVMEGKLRLNIELDYVLSIDNGPIFRDRVLRAFQKLAEGLATNGIAHGRVTKHVVTEGDT